MSLTIEHLTNLQSKLQNDSNDYQIELREGNLIVMGPSDIVSSYIGAQLSRLLGNWVTPRRLGLVFDSSGGFILPNADLTAPDVSYVSRSRMPRTVRYFSEVVPDLVVEIKSQSEKPFGHSFAYRITKLQEKLQMFLGQGVKVGILIDPDELTVTLYRHHQTPIVFTDNETLTLPELLPGWELQISDLWPPVFEENGD
ncbi:Uma2 family endonuclease [Laspinema sp. D1]|uniref:Uma2 family endonuclease n=1 Tax=Laspinema palackyanum TaxID=3231601 RepID=UPI00348A4CC5|nr:Uma2 family endonuclease [Laspinema sp. D2b]